MNLRTLTQSIGCNSVHIEMKKQGNLSDASLIVQYREGNIAVLPVLVKRYHKVFCEQAYWITKDKEIAKDIAQECWIIIIRKLHTLDHADRFKSWALRIVYTKAIDEVKRRKKEDENTRANKLIEPKIQSSEEDSLRIQKALLRAIRGLPRQKQDIIRLFYTEEYSVKEISAFLGIPVGTVKSRLFKAREKLKSLLKNEIV